mgnify:CR=1 FL=1
MLLTLRSTLVGVSQTLLLKLKIKNKDFLQSFVTSLTDDLKALETEYAALNIEDQIKNNTASLVLTDKNLVQITTLIEKMRKSITD